jgi:transposase-like protein
MANVLNKDKQIAVISALAEGSSIRAIERITGISRNTIMRLGVRVGEGCARLLGCEDAESNLPLSAI